MPDVSGHILLHMIKEEGNGGAEQFRFRLVYVGPRSVHVFTDRRQRALTFMARLTPGTVPVALPGSLSEWTNHSIALQEFIGKDRQLGVNNLRTSAIRYDVSGLLLCFERLCKNILVAPSELVRTAALVINRAPVPGVVKQTAAAMGVSQRHLRSVFKRETGLTPKRYARIQRVTNAVRASDINYPFGWSQLALENGYYDQSHMIDEFQALLGESAEKFIARQNREDIVNMPR